MNDKTEPWKWGDENQPKPEEPPHIEGQRHLCCGYDAYMRPFDKGNWVAYEDYARLKAEVERLKVIEGKQEVIDNLHIEVKHLDLFKSVVEKFFNSADLKNPPDAQSCYALAEKLKQLPDSILDFTEEQVRDNPAWALAVFRHKVKEMQYKRIHDLNAIGGEQEENARLKAEVERLTFDPLTYLDDHGEWMPRHIHLAAVERLTAEVERLKEIIRREVDGGVGLREEAQRTVEENHKLRAEVERLRKAGDAVWICLEAYLYCKPYDGPMTIKCLNAWNAAKDGKPSV